jgi:hypothetical protein
MLGQDLLCGFGLTGEVWGCGWRRSTNVGGHELEATAPVGDVEVSVAEPSVSVVCAAAPFCFGHVVVEMDVDLLLCELSGDSVIYLLLS